MNRAAVLGICLLSTGVLAVEPQGPGPQALTPPSYFFPSAANAQGAFGAYFRTRLVLTNPGSSPIDVVATLSTRTGSGGTRTITLGPSETLVTANFLQDRFGFTGGGGFSLTERTSSSPFYAVAEVWAENANGRFSTSLPGLSADDRVVNLALAETGYSMSTGLFVDGSNRANFGCANMDGAPVSIRADIYDESSSVAPVAKAQLDLLGKGWEQQSVAVTGQVIRILFWQLTAGGLNGSYCYGVNVNNSSGDGTVSPALWVPRVN